MDKRLITVAIHTYDRAVALKSLLEREGLEVSLQNVNLQCPVVSSGVRVRIKESDLPVALRIIENRDLFDTDTEKSEDSSPLILVPVDFSDYSDKACEIAFRLADRHKATIVLLHSYTNPASFNRLQLSDVLSFDESGADRDSSELIKQEANRRMEILCDGLRDKIKDCSLPAVKFTTEVVEGLPEDTINQFSKSHLPLLIVMGTRGADKKEREMVGSVTAEVLDTCRFPVLTVPETMNPIEACEPECVLFFSNFDQEDILAMDALFRLMPFEHIKVVLVGIPEKKQSKEAANTALDRLCTYCRKHYPAHEFSVESISVNAIDDDFSRITDGVSGKLIAVPNKKKNIFARLFNPGMAHKMLFHIDTPMIVIPV